MGAEVKSMEVKKPQQSIVNDSSWTFKRVQDFVIDVKGEVHKITWTNREELLTYTKIVVGATFIFGMSIYVLDLTIQSVLSGLTFLLHLISG